MVKYDLAGHVLELFREIHPLMQKHILANLTFSNKSLKKQYVKNIFFFFFFLVISVQLGWTLNCVLVRKHFAFLLHINIVLCQKSCFLKSCFLSSANSLLHRFLLHCFPCSLLVFRTLAPLNRRTFIPGLSVAV